MLGGQVFQAAQPLAPWERDRFRSHDLFGAICDPSPSLRAPPRRNGLPSVPAWPRSPKKSRKHRHAKVITNERHDLAGLSYVEGVGSYQVEPTYTYKYVGEGRGTHDFFDGRSALPHMHLLPRWAARWACCALLGTPICLLCMWATVYLVADASGSSGGDHWLDWFTEAFFGVTFHKWWTGEESKAHDCDIGFSSWQTAWPESKKRFCCRRMERGCPLGSEWEGRAFSTSAPYECRVGLDVSVVETWSDSERRWCCENKRRGCSNRWAPAVAGASAPAPAQAVHGQFPPTKAPDKWSVHMARSSAAAAAALGLRGSVSSPVSPLVVTQAPTPRPTVPATLAAESLLLGGDPPAEIADAIGTVGAASQRLEDMVVAQAMGKEGTMPTTTTTTSQETVPTTAQPPLFFKSQLLSTTSFSTTAAFAPGGSTPQLSTTTTTTFALYFTPLGATTSLSTTAAFAPGGSTTSLSTTAAFAPGGATLAFTTEALPSPLTAPPASISTTAAFAPAASTTALSTMSAFAPSSGSTSPTVSLKTRLDRWTGKKLGRLARAAVEEYAGVHLKAALAPYNCTLDVENFIVAWSSEKTKWCCSNEDTGCPDGAKP